MRRRRCREWRRGGPSHRDGFFVVFDSARDSIDCAGSIQRRLAEHRLKHGFSPTVRIGIHVAEARQQNDYSGVDVHVAERIGDLGDGEEIVASSELLRAAGTTRASRAWMLRQTGRRRQRRFAGPCTVTPSTEVRWTRQ